jgi:hypothetical protein
MLGVKLYRLSLISGVATSALLTPAFAQPDRVTVDIPA